MVRPDPPNTVPRSRRVTKLAVFTSTLAAGTLAFAGATPFSDGFVATHGKVGSSTENDVLHESCTWGYKNPVPPQVLSPQQ